MGRRPCPTHAYYTVAKSASRDVVYIILGAAIHSERFAPSREGWELGFYVSWAYCTGWLAGLSSASLQLSSLALMTMIECKPECGPRIAAAMIVMGAGTFRGIIHVCVNTRRQLTQESPILHEDGRGATSISRVQRSCFQLAGLCVQGKPAERSTNCL